MTRQPLVSIILAVCKVERFIARSSRALFGQTYPNIEYIFVDDGTPDNSIGVMQSVLEDFPERKPHVKVVHQQNMGLPAARQTGLKYATGDFVLFSDPDDWCKTTLVEKLVAAAVREDADIAICNYYNAYRFYNILRREKKYPTKQQTMRAMLCHHHFRGYVWDKLVKRELYTEIPRFTPTLDQCEDLILTVQTVGCCRKYVHIKDRLCYYRKNNPNSLTKRDRRMRTEETVTSTMMLYEAWQGVSPSPFDGVEIPFLLMNAAQIINSALPHLFGRFPVIESKVRDIILSFPSREYKIDIPLKDQKAIRKRYELYLSTGVLPMPRVKKNVKR